jgi:hypothetical protein
LTLASFPGLFAGLAAMESFKFFRVKKTFAVSKTLSSRFGLTALSQMSSFRVAAIHIRIQIGFTT